VSASLRRHVDPHHPVTTTAIQTTTTAQATTAHHAATTTTTTTPAPDAVWNIDTTDALPQMRNASIVDGSVTSVRPADRLEEANFRGNVPSALAYSN